MKKKILIYDDEDQVMNELRADIINLPALEDFEIETLSQKEFGDSMATLQERRRAVRKAGSWDGGPIPLDEASIFVIDFDLFGYKDPFLTGEAVAYLARCFTNCELIIAVNQFFKSDFDLTLKGHPESYADLNVTQKGFSNPALWGVFGEIKEGFRPWYWPIMPKYQQDFEAKVKDVKQNLNHPIGEVLGFDPPDLFDMLPRSITQYIGSEPAKTTFREFAKNSGNGLRAKDAAKANDDILARVGAARISKWLERLVLSQLDILIDAPHLVSRYPSLIAGDKEDINIWNKTAQLTSYTELGLDTERIEPFRFKKDFWLSRPVWLWGGLRECEDIVEVRTPWETSRPDWVFCEDMSLFWDGDPREFVADVESPFARRYVREFDDFEYRPKVRFSL